MRMELIEQRMRKQLKKTLTGSGEVEIVVFDELTEFMIDRVLARPHTIKFHKLKSPWSCNMLDSLIKKYPTELVAMPWTADDTAEFFLGKIAEGSSNFDLPHNLIPTWDKSKSSEVKELAEKLNKQWVYELPRENLLRYAKILGRDPEMVYGLAKSAHALQNFK